MDPNFCEYYIVTLPEELPMQEALELNSSLQNEFSLTPKLIVNRVLETNLRSTDLGVGSEDFSKYFHILLSRQEAMMQKLEMLKIKPLIIPWIFDLQPMEFVTEIAKSFQGAR